MNKKFTALLLIGLASQAKADHRSTIQSNLATTHLRIYDESSPSTHAAYEDEYCDIEYSTETWLHADSEETKYEASSSKSSKSTVKVISYKEHSETISKKEPSYDRPSFVSGGYGGNGYNNG